MKFLLILFGVFIGINALEVTVDEGEHGQIQCSQNEIIFVQNGKWTYQFFNWRNGFTPTLRNLVPFSYLFGELIGLCTYNVTDAVKNICDGKNECQIDGNRVTLHNDECNYWMKVIVTYECVDCSQYENRNKRSLSPISGDDHQLVRFKRQFKTQSSLCAAVALALMVPRYNRVCPHNVFTIKHVCNNCPTITDVETFAANVDALRQQNFWAPTNINTVFIGNPTYTQAGTTCTFSNALPKYVCQLYHGSWSCADQYQNRRAQHNVNSGHFLGDF